MRLIAATSVGLLFAAPAAAQDHIAAAASTDDAIVVTGRGLDAPPGSAAYASVSIDRDRLQNLASDRIEDALRDVAGLAQFRRADSRSAHPTSQGATLRGLGGNAASRVLVLLDGVPQADPFGGWVAFPAYAPDRLGAVRVTRGGGSGYAGPGALAGTIELSSANAGELGPLALHAAGGSRAGLDVGGTLAAPLGTGFVTLGADVARGDGFVPIVAEARGPADRAAPYAQASAALRGVVAIGADAELQANLSGFRDRRDRGLAGTRVASDGADASLRLVHRGRWNASLLAYLQSRAFASGFASANDARTSVTRTLDQYSVPATGTGGRIELSSPAGSALTLRFGGDWRRVSGETHELYSYVAGAPTRRRVAGGAATTLGAFADASLVRGPLTLSLGGRLDRWWIADGRLVEAPLQPGAPITDQRFADRQGWAPTGRGGIAVAVAPALALRAAAYRGWRLPTLNELYRPFRAGADATAANAALAPETLLGAEAGVDWHPLPALSLRATGYWNRLDDAIANVTLARGPGNFAGVGFVSAAGSYRQRQNLRAIRAHGVELDAEWNRGPWRLAASWAWTDARVSARGAAAALDGLRPAQTPAHQASLTVAWQRDGRHLGITARYLGPQFEDDQNVRRLADAFTLDAVLVLPVTGRLAVEARAENLADARVEAAVSGPGVIERASPRTLWLGLRYRLR